MPSPIESGKFKAKATLNPPLKPPQVIIKAVFFSKDFLIERSKIGSFTPINLDKTQINIIKIEMNKYETSNDSNIKIISKPIKINSIAFLSGYVHSNRNFIKPVDK